MPLIFVKEIDNLNSYGNSRDFVDACFYHPAISTAQYLSILYILSKALIINVLTSISSFRIY